MADFTPSTSSDEPLVSVALDDAFEDACSICLEPFNIDEPATITSCKHEYHLQCILEWSQRSKECPICWQLLVLKDPASQELLAAVESERLLRSNNRSAAPTTIPHFQEGLDIDHDTSNSDDSDFDEDIMQRLAAAASRARYVHRRERQRSFGLGPSQVPALTSSANMSNVQQNGESSSSDEGDSPRSVAPAVPFQCPQPVVAVNGEGPFKARVIHQQPPPENPHTQSPPEMSSFSESIKSKWSAASARYKESISKGTRGFKEKLLARNNSVKELSKGVQREMNAGIAGVARMMERLDISTKRTGSSVSSCAAGGTSDFSSKGKGVQVNVSTQSLSKNCGEIEHDLSSDASSCVSGATLDRLDFSHSQSGR